MKIAIITRGRVGNLHTLASIPYELLKDTYIVCPLDEVPMHEVRHPAVNVISEGEEPLTYSRKFHKIVNGHYPELGRRILIMDDDLRFSMRENGGGVGARLVKATPRAVLEGIMSLDHLLNDYPLAGLHPRAMGNNAPRGIKECSRINAMQAVNLDLIGQIKLDHWPILADMVLNLSLLTRGQKTAVWCELFWDQVGGSNAPGGCSLHRTAEQQAEAVYGLHNLFPNFVDIRLKEVKKGWFGGGTQRVDFVIQWQKAYKWGAQHAKAEL